MLRAEVGQLSRLLNKGVRLTRAAGAVDEPRMKCPACVRDCRARFAQV